MSIQPPHITCGAHKFWYGLQAITFLRQAPQLMRAFLAAVVISVASARVSLPFGLGWANLAFGYEQGGKDIVTGHKLVLVDLNETVANITSLKNNGHIVVCYFSAGTLEAFRGENVTQWKPALTDASYCNGRRSSSCESWLNIKLPITRQLQQKRFELARDKGCQAVAPDHVDCSEHSECRGEIDGISNREQAKAAQIEYNSWMVSLAHQLDLSIALMNAVSIISNMSQSYDFTINESCIAFDECSTLQPFFLQNKAVLVHEYSKTSCTLATKYNITLKYCDSTWDELCPSNKPWVNCFNTGQGGGNNGGGGTGNGPPPTAPTPPTPQPTFPTPRPTFVQGSPSAPSVPSPAPSPAPSVLGAPGSDGDGDGNGLLIALAVGGGVLAVGGAYGAYKKLSHSSPSVSDKGSMVASDPVQ